MRIRLKSITIAMALAASSYAHAATTQPSTRPSLGSSRPITSFADQDIDANLGAAGSDTSPELGLYQDIPIVVAASKFAETVHQAPASVSVVTADDIELFNYRSVADLLRNQRSFYLGTDGLNWFAGTRGFLRSGEWNARMLVLVDGRPTNEIIFGQSNIDPDFVLPMEAVKQVEIIRGPGSALYGAGAVFSVVNVVSKSGSDVNGAEVKMEGGSQDTLHGNALVGFNADGWDILGDFSGFNSAGEKQLHIPGVYDPAHNYGFIDNADGQDAYDGFVKVKKGDFTAEFDYANREIDNSQATYLASFTDPGQMYEQRTNTTLRIDHDLGNDQSLHAMAYYGHYGYNQDYGIAASGQTPAYEYATTASDDWLGEDIHYDWQANKSIHLLAGVDGTLGLDARQHDYDSLHDNLIDLNSSYNTAAVFAQGEFQLCDWLSVTAGGRVDQVQRLGTSVSPRGAFVLTPEKQDTFKLLYGQAFREPNLYELFYNSPGSNTPNPSLNAEVVDTYEVDWEHQFQDGWQTSASAYLWHMNNAMDDVQLSDGSVQTQNIGTSMARGLEAEIDRRWESRASFRAYATYTWAEQDDVLPTLSPKWIVGTALALPICKNNFLSVEPQFVGPMKSGQGTFTQPTYITDIVFTSEHLFKNWTLQAGVYNLFAKYARLPSGGPFEQFQSQLNYPPTQYLVSLTCKF